MNRERTKQEAKPDTEYKPNFKETAISKPIMRRRVVKAGEKTKNKKHNLK